MPHRTAADLSPKVVSRLLVTRCTVRGWQLSAHDTLCSQDVWCHVRGGARCNFPLSNVPPAMCRKFGAAPHCGFRENTVPLSSTPAVYLTGRQSYLWLLDTTGCRTTLPVSEVRAPLVTRWIQRYSYLHQTSLVSPQWLRGLPSI